MKRIANLALAAVTLIAPLTPAVASAQSWRHDARHDNRHEQRYERNHHWRRGERLPSSYRSHYAQVDWRQHHLRQPPRGYHWVRDDRGEYLLVGLATGVILSALLNN